MRLKKSIHCIGSVMAKSAPRWWKQGCCTWALVLSVAGYLVTASPARAQVYYGTAYSGASTGSNGTVYGWGVTDVWYSDSYHTAQVTTWLTSPNGRTVNGGGTDYNFKRADVSLPYAANDLGTYLVSSSHYATCPFMRLLMLTQTAGETTVPKVTLTLRNSNQVSTDNSARGVYNTQLGTYNLGTFFSAGSSDPLFRTGVEVVGSVNPATFTGTIIFWRDIVQKRVYNHTTELTQYRKDNQPDNYDWAFQDQTCGAGKVYDLDAPAVGTPANAPQGYIIRQRMNFREWAALPNGTKVSADLLWFSRLSVIRTSPTTEALQWQSGVTGDNTSGVGNPPTTWCLQATCQ